MTDSFFSHSVLSLKASPTIAITMKARQLKAEGLDIIELGAGEPDFDTPDNIKEYAIKAINAGKTKYTPVDGIPELKKAIVAKFTRENNLNFTTDEITVGTGAKQTLFNCLMATINPGDEVIIPSPFWVSYPDIVELFGGKSVIVKGEEQNNFKITPKQLQDSITPKTKWFIFNSPSNPTGQVYTKEELLALGQVLSQHKNVHILCDDIYEHLTYSTKFYTLPQVCPDLLDRCFVLNGVSKAYAMTGWRIGYAGCKNKELIKAISKIQSQSTSNPSSVSQEAAVEALNGTQNFIPSFQQIFAKRRDLFVNGINSINGLTAKNPDGAFYVFFSVKNLFEKSTPKGQFLSNCTEVASYFLENGVAVVPGSAFGYTGYARASYTTTEENLHKAIERIKKAVESLK